MAEVEKSGVPTFAYVSRPFDHDFKTSAKIYGVPGVPHAFITERALVTMTADEIHQRVDTAIDETIVGLTVLPEVKEAITEETVSLASTLLGQDVPEKE